MLVVDASVLAPALADDTSDGDAARARLQGLALADLVDLPLRRVPHIRLLERCWQLRHNLTAYDAAYVALAERLDLILVTADARLSKVPGLRCQVEVLS